MADFLTYDEAETFCKAQKLRLDRIEPRGVIYHVDSPDDPTEVDGRGLPVDQVPAEVDA